jgi:hypothetical protein
MKKLCKKCKESKPLDSFYRNPSTYDGKQANCKQCYKGYKAAKKIEKKMSEIIEH